MFWANGKGEFFRVENKTSILRCEWIISARDDGMSKILRLFCKEKLCKKTLYSGIQLICEFPKQFLTITKPCFLVVYYCFCLFGEFANVFERKVWRVQVAICIVQRVHFKSESVFSANLDKDFFRCLLCWDPATIFTNAKSLLTSCVLLQRNTTWSVI